MFPPASIFHSHRTSAANLVFASAALALFAPALPVLAQNSAAPAQSAAAPAQSAPAASQIDPLVVRTTAGLVRGITRSNGGAQFLGIPYAEPPVGPLRWRAPVPKKSWSGVRDANAFGSSCAQPLLGGAWNRHDAENSSEDCLYLNVITPAWPAATPLPVMFWMHGGANEGGSGSGSLYNDGTLLNHGVLIVTINYRLGIFGFFAHPELTRESPHQASGDYGLMDQILALQWVHENIARFGGDPNNVTVFGQSAGSMDTGILMASPLARGLFQKAIGESGAPFYPVLAPFDQAEQAGEQFAASFPVLGSHDPIAFLRQVSAPDLIAKASNSMWGNPPVGPIVDGWVVPRSPEETFKSGKEAPIPLLLGTTTREFGASESPDALRKSIEDYAGKFAPQALALYGLAGDDGQGAADPLYGSAGVQWNADVEFHCPISTEALWHTAAHHPTFEYELDHAIPGQEAQGALHSAELPYVFGSFPTSANISGNFGPIDIHLADLMEDYWTNFAKTGDPNGRGPQEAMSASWGGNGAGLPHWPEFDATQLYLIFTEDGQGLASAGPLRAPQCDLYREILAVRMKQGN
ncbi:MAG: carboxylesterase family protein [Terracidiphilus sp.]